jgi:thiol-disulfide isomerase/thioredoxin
MSKKRKRKTQPFSRLPRGLILIGLLIAVVAVLLAKREPTPQTVNSKVPEVQLAQALEAGKPTFAFYHSLDCVPCKQMMATVDQVYPQYADQVVLVDVNVYDSWNQPLLRTARVRSIPTMVFYNHTGEQQTVIGAMEPEQLDQMLATISERPSQ